MYKITPTVRIAIDELLDLHKHSFYWLSKQTGVSYTTLWRLKKGKALGINFSTLEKICHVLECGPGDVLRLDPAKVNVPPDMDKL